MHVAYEAFMTIVPLKFPTTTFFMAWRSGCGECSNTFCCLRVCLFCFSHSCPYLCSISVCVLPSTSRSVFEIVFCSSYSHSFLFLVLLSHFCFSCWFLSVLPASCPFSPAIAVSLYRSLPLSIWSCSAFSFLAPLPYLCLC